MKRLLIACTFGLVLLLVGAIWTARSTETTSAAAQDNTEVAWHSQDDEYLISLFTVGGRPVNADANHRVKVLVNHGFAIGYCEERRNPLWAVYVASGLSTGEPERVRPSAVLLG